MKFKSIKINYIYNLLLTMVNMIFPLMTSSYLSATLGAENIGKVNYASSVVTWFLLFASFGIPRYGIREISKKRNNKKDLASVFWNLLLVQLVFSLVAIFVYIVLVFTLPTFKSEIQLFLLMLIMIVLNIFSIDWFYQGIEEYKYIAVRNIIVKIGSIVLIFLLINEKEDYLIYSLINIIGLTFNNFLNYRHARKYIEFKIYNFKFIHYLKELRVYFMTNLIIAIYLQLDQLFIGNISTKDLAYYVRSKMVLGIGIGIVNSLITVLIPRTAYLMENDYSGYKKNVEKSINYIYLLAIPCAVGIFLLAKEVMILLGGTEFLSAIVSLQVISILVLVQSIGNWQVNQVFLPHRMENVAFRIQCFAAIISVILNLLLIPKYSYIGAAVTWVIVELSLMIIEGIIIKYKCKDINIRYINPSLFKYILSVILMAIGVIYIKANIDSVLIIVVLCLLTAPFIYFGSLILFKETILLEFANSFKRKIKSQLL